MSFVCQYRSRERRHNNPLWQRSTAHAGFASANFIARTRNVAIKAIPPRVCVCVLCMPVRDMVYIRGSVESDLLRAVLKVISLDFFIFQ